jgi:hypothetical protein
MRAYGGGGDSSVASLGTMAAGQIGLVGAAGPAEMGVGKEAARSENPRRCASEETPRGL